MINFSEVLHFIWLDTISMLCVLLQSIDLMLPETYYVTIEGYT